MSVGDDSGVMGCDFHIVSFLVSLLWHVHPSIYYEWPVTGVSVFVGSC